MNHPDSAPDISWELECTLKCHSHVHASKIISAVTRGDNAEIQAYCRWLCYNFSSVTDKWGRNILHMIAACGKWKLIEWLIKNYHSEINVKDGESGWTALHRSLFYGQIAAARMLLLYGASLNVHDHEGLTPFEILIKDRPPYIEYNKHNPSEVYVWGSNTNFNLGLGNEQSRSNPELLDMFRKENISIKQVIMCKFHSVFLSIDGHVFTCGHGHGGRLGQNSEKTALTPHPIKGLGSTICQEIAAGQDHLVLLTEDGQVWTCGLNTYHQLGHVPPPERLLIPRPLSLKFKEQKEFVGICAARYHTVLYTKEAVFTFGLNAGQLGHLKGNRTQISPRQVSTLDHKDWKITHVVASVGATVCATNKGDVYVLHEYQCRKIASRQLEIQKLSVVGGHLDSHCEPASTKEGNSIELRIIILTKSGKIFLWRESYPHLRRCIFNIGRQLFITDLQITHSMISFITNDGEGFQGNFIFPNTSTSAEATVLAAPPICNSKSTLMVSSLHSLLNKDECDLIRIKRLHSIHRAVQITSDSQGKNFAVLQSHPKIGLTELPTLPSSKMQENFLQLLQSVHADDIIHDIVIKVGNNHFFAHKYILASQSEYFCKLFTSKTESNGILQTVSINDISPDDFEQILQFIYSNECDYLKEGKEVVKKKSNSYNTNIKNISNDDMDLSVYEISQKKKKKNCKEKKINENPLMDLREASKKLGISHLLKRLKNIKVINGKIKVIEELTNNFTKLQFNRKNLINLYDVKLLSEDKKEFNCHRCVLVARSEYFHNMLASNWIETSSLEHLSLSIQSEVLEIVLDYLYTDNAPKIYASENPELVCNTLITADLILIDRLKAICELALVDIITLKNAGELLELSFIYNASQLKIACMEYICINLPAILENGCLNIVSDEIMEELTKFYRNLVPAMNKRIITPYSMGPTQKEMQYIAENFPINNDAEHNFLHSNANALKCEKKVKSRHRIHSHKSSTEEIDTSKEKIDAEDLSSQELHSTNSPVTDILENKNSNKNIICDNISNIPDKNNSSLKYFGKDGWIKTFDEDIPKLKDIMMEEQIAENLTKKQVNITRDFNDKSLSISKAKPNFSYSKTIHSPKNLMTSPTSINSNIWKDNFFTKSSKTTKEETLQNTNTLSLFFPSLDESMNLNLKNAQSISHCEANPWNKNVNQEEKPVPNLDEILRAEQQNLTLIKQQKAKSLNFIHLEDEAIEELLKLYGAENNPEERVTIQRLLPVKTATPVWKNNPLL